MPAEPRGIEAFQEEHDHEEDKEHDDGDGVGNGGQDSTELLAAHAEDGSHATSHTEEACPQHQR